MTDSDYRKDWQSQDIQPSQQLYDNLMKQGESDQVIALMMLYQCLRLEASRNRRLK